MDSSSNWQFALAATIGILSASCSTETPDFSRRASATTGPSVRYDLVAGLEAVPWPNDTLCWLDDEQSGPCLPNLPTAGLAPYLANWVQAIDATRGWSTNGPIVVPFENASDNRTGAAIDLARLLALQQDRDWQNDAIYLVDLQTGLPHTLDFPTTRGSFILHEPVALDPSDVRRAEPSLTVETIYENVNDPTTSHAAGSEASDEPMYRQSWDTDSDGALDVPTMLPGHRCAPPTKASDGTEGSTSFRDRCLADEVVEAYDLTTNTLRLYPRSPLTEGREYAVVVTDRLVDTEERPIGSPFSSISHPRQDALTQRVLDWLKTPDLARYYGSIAEDLTRHIRFVWGFTTATPTRDLRSRFQRWQPDLHAPANPSLSPATRLRIERQYDLDVACSELSSRSAISALLRELLNLSPSEQGATAASLSAIDHVVVGTLSHPVYTGDSTGTSLNSAAEVTSITNLPFWLTLPKGISVDAADLRVVLVSHELGGTQVEGLRWAGYWASLGLATLGFARAGTPMDALDLALANVQAQFNLSCTAELLMDLTRPRSDAAASARRFRSDVDPDVVATRDRWRFDAVELATLVRALQTRLEVPQSLGLPQHLSPIALVGVGTGAASAALAASLVPGELSLVMVDPATSPDRAWRRGATWGASASKLWHVFGPRIAGVPVSDLKGAETQCNATDSSLRLVNADTVGVGTELAGVEIGCLPLGSLSGTRTAIATNLSTLSRRCVAVSKSGQFSLGLPAAAGDAIELAIYDSLDVVRRLGRDADCTLVSEGSAPVFLLGAEGPGSSGYSLTAGTHGLGLERQSSELLHALDLAAAAFAPANPAPFVADLTQPSSPTDSRGVLLSISPGDSVVPSDEGLALARAARLIPKYLPETLNAYWELASDVTPGVASALTKPTAAARVEEARLDEGVPRLARFPVNVSTCGSNLTREITYSATCSAPVLDAKRCSQYLPDLDALAGTDSGFGARQPIPSLRLARYAGRPTIDNVSELWSPQSRVIGLAVQPTHPNWPFVALALPLADPLGSHGIPRDDLCHGFRFGTYVPYLIGQFSLSGGTDYPPVTHRDTQLCLANPQQCNFLTLLN